MGIEKEKARKPGYKERDRDREQTKRNRDRDRDRETETETRRQRGQRGREKSADAGRRTETGGQTKKTSTSHNIEEENDAIGIYSSKYIQKMVNTFQIYLRRQLCLPKQKRREDNVRTRFGRGGGGDKARQEEEKRHNTTRHDTNDTTRHDTTRHDTTRHDTTRVVFGAAKLAICIGIAV
jgi:hypothetical protein